MVSRETMGRVLRGLEVAARWRFIEGLRAGIRLAVGLARIRAYNERIGERAAGHLARLEHRAYAFDGYRIGQRLARWLARGGHRR